MPRRRKPERMAREEYALSAMTASGLRRGRPTVSTCLRSLTALADGTKSRMLRVFQDVLG
jgi:hypothetical protein